MVRMTFTSFQLNMYDWVEFTDNTDNWNPYFITRSGSVPSFTVYSTGRGQLGVKVKGLKGDTGKPAQDSLQLTQWFQPQFHPELAIHKKTPLSTWLVKE